MKLLIADDEPLLRDTIADVVAADFDVVYQAENGIEAVETAHREQPDIVIMDVVMPGLDGLEACRRLRAVPEFRHVPILVLSATDNEKSLREAFDAGASDFLAKPFSTSQLRTRMHILLHRRSNNFAA